ncbi:MAG: hypothetical protein ACE37F_14990 [Nannocystaceae bacterium]|nr:hypothetical protein [bacterium]
MRSRPFPPLSVPAALLALVACNPHPLKDVELSRTAETVLDVDIAPLRNVDILFVIDNSGSMAAEQANLAANLAPMIEELEREDIAADYRIAVTTTDVADSACSTTGPEDGNFVASSCRSRLEQFVTLPGYSPAEDARESACTSLCPESLADLRVLPTTTSVDADAQPRPWIENILGSTNLPEDVSTEQAFACMGPQGVDGCGVEAPLRAMQRALTRAGASSEDEYGFLRDDAILLVVFVTDEADCSSSGAFPTELVSDGTSVGCWNAGVRCTEQDDGTLDCASANLDASGNEVSADEAVLRPVEEYVDLLEAIRDHKRAVTGSDEVDVMVSVVAGVPTGFPDAPVVYDRRTPFAELYGIDAGCQSAFGDAVPPVRLLELAEAFAPPTGTNVSSVCAESFQPAITEVTDQLLARFEPTCVDTCLAGGRGEDCVFRERVPGEEERAVAQCDLASDGSPVLPEDANSCIFIAVDRDRHPTCQASGAATEFRALHRPGVARVPGSKISATCSVSDDEAFECPWAQ